MGGPGFTFENTISSYDLMAWACTYSLRVVMGPCAQCCPCEVSGPKDGLRIRSLTEGDRVELLTSIGSSRRADNFGGVKHQNWMKNGRVMPIKATGGGPEVPKFFISLSERSH